MATASQNDIEAISAFSQRVSQVRRVTSKAAEPAKIISHLRLSPVDRAAVLEHINLVGVDGWEKQYEYTYEDQAAAFKLFAELGLHMPDDSAPNLVNHDTQNALPAPDVKRDARSKLTIIRTDTKPSKARDGRTLTRIWRLYQCLCGIDNTDGRLASKKRQISWKIIGCGAWFRLTSTHDRTDPDPSKHAWLTIDQLIGDFTHSPQCQELLEMQRNPRIPLQPDLREYALSLLRSKMPLPQLRSHCRDWSHKRWGGLIGDEHHRFVITDYETTSLYRTLAKESGIAQKTTAEQNLDSWFRADNPLPPDTRLTASCMFYQPLTTAENSRFILILSTPEMRALAWQFGHKKQLIMDLTFGVCNARMLVPILMVIDDEGKGLPVAFILFTARKQAKAVHADYDKTVLEFILTKWKTAMGKNEEGEEFTAAVGSTDNDARERHALRSVWPDILLLLCIFHVWQAWRNALVRYLRVIPKGPDRQHVRSRLGKFLVSQLKDISDYESAITSYNSELSHFKKLASSRSDVAKSQSKGGLGFLAYLQGYLKVREMWTAWSLAGAQEAASRMGILLNQVARTTNHLESFNGRLKGSYITQHKHSGRLPRADAWVLAMITQVMPDFLDSWAERRKTKNYYEIMRSAKGTGINSKLTCPRLAKPTPETQSANTLESAAKDWLLAVISSTTPSTPNAGTDAKHLEELEVELLAELEADEEEAEDEDGEEVDAEAVEEMEGYGLQLEISADGDSSWASDACEPPSPRSFENRSASAMSITSELFEVPSIAGPDALMVCEPDISLSDTTDMSPPEDNSDDFLDDHALNSSSIVENLPPDVSLPFPFTLAQPRSSPDSDHSFLHDFADPCQTANSSTHNMSIDPIPNPNVLASAAAYRTRIESLETQLATALHGLMELGTEPEFLIHHLSPSIQLRLDHLATQTQDHATEDAAELEADVGGGEEMRLDRFEKEIKTKRLNSRSSW